ncbi:MAG: nucleoside 2-deoxyribosyltransferase [Pirellulales bacterium]|nr:nucleoside 2-deoxyribosyltransferase [Pirellulales bacterium]
MRKRVYLAGPEVFLRNAESVFRAKREICQRYGFRGVSPLESHLDSEPLPQKELGWRISRSNEFCMRSCDLVIANLTPFRSPSADPGTAYELGFMRALGKPVLGYTNVCGTLRERTAQFFPEGLRARRPGKGLEDPEGLLVEDFDLIDNLMLDGAVLSSGFPLIVIEAPPGEKFSCLAGFEQCVQQAARALLGLDAPRPAAVAAE